MVLESMRIQESVVNFIKLADVFSSASKDEDSLLHIPRTWLQPFLVAIFFLKNYTSLDRKSHLWVTSSH
jgi:hypothetical protein